MSHFLVTGGAGFIGSNICEMLLKQGHTVTVLDNFETGLWSNVDPFHDHADFRCVKGDVRSSRDCLDAMRGVDYVLHQAALGSVPRSVKDPWTSHDVNVNGTMTVLEAARTCGVKRVVMASSSSVYGGVIEGRGVYEGQPVRPRSPYAATKVSGEAYMRGYNDVFADVETVILRYFNVYGPRQRPDGPYAAVIPRFIFAIQQGKPLQICGDGEQTRDFTFVKDVARLNIMAALKLPGVWCGRPINGGGGHPVTINELGHACAVACGVDPGSVAVQHQEERAGDVKHCFANTDRLGLALDFVPTFSLSEGLEKTVEWFKNG